MNMAGSKVIQVFLLISFVIFPTLALHVLLSDGDDENGFNYETDINYHNDGPMKVYEGRAINNTYVVGPATKKVIVYIKALKVMKDTVLRKMCRDTRVEITEELCKLHYEILYLGVGDFRRGEQHLIAKFLDESITSNLPNLQIKTIAERSLEHPYRTVLYDLETYEEERDIFQANLVGKLRTMDVGYNF